MLYGIDLAIIVIYFVGMVALGIYMGGRQSNTKD